MVIINSTQSFRNHVRSTRHTQIRCQDPKEGRNRSHKDDTTSTYCTAYLVLIRKEHTEQVTSSLSNLSINETPSTPKSAARPRSGQRDEHKTGSVRRERPSVQNTPTSSQSTRAKTAEIKQMTPSYMKTDKSAALDLHHQGTYLNVFQSMMMCSHAGIQAKDKDVIMLQLSGCVQDCRY